MALMGCRESAYRQPVTFEDTTTAVQVDRFRLAIDLLENFEEYDHQQGPAELLKRLNRWVNEVPRKIEVVRDPLFESAAAEFAEVKQNAHLRSLTFRQEDIFYLQETIWLREIARVASVRDTRTPQLQRWCDQQRELIGDDGVTDLAIAIELFNWTVTHLQLEKTTAVGRRSSEVGPLPALQPEATQAVEKKAQDEKANTVEIEAGPGEVRSVWEALILGQADAWERARVFMLLARQQGIPVVALAADTGHYLQPRVWSCGVLINSNLYLFDTNLGFPIPGIEGRGIATLAEVFNDVNLLRRLDLEQEGFQYPIQQNDLQRTVALIDVAPLTQADRMRLVESHLVADQYLALTVSPVQIAELLKSCQGIAAVNVWRLPFAMKKLHDCLPGTCPARDRHADLIKKLVRYSGPISNARILHLKGRLNSSFQKPGARELYLDCRPSNRQIEKLMTSPALQRQIGLDELKPKDRQVYFESIIERKQIASYWLGVLAFEIGEYEEAIDFLGKRTLALDADSLWANGARFNLARAYEQLGNTKRAQKIYREDQSPQRYGNLLRARRLASLDE